MDDEDIRALLERQQELLNQQSEELMKGYLAQYQQMANDAVDRMQEMVAEARKQTEDASKPKDPIHMTWTEVNGSNVLVMSEEAGKAVLAAFDQLADILPKLQKALKGR